MQMCMIGSLFLVSSVRTSVLQLLIKGRLQRAFRVRAIQEYEYSSYKYLYPFTWKVRPRTSAWYQLYVEATRRNLILPDLPEAIETVEVRQHLVASTDNQYQIAGPTSFESGNNSLGKQRGILHNKVLENINRSYCHTVSSSCTWSFVLACVALAFRPQLWISFIASNSFLIGIPKTVYDSTLQICLGRMIHFDVVIVGSGPAGLACLSGIQEQYSFDTLTDAQKLRAEKHNRGAKKKRVAVIDPSPQWMAQWRQHFSALGITVLRSPAMAHPDLFDMNALLAFATSQGRSSELVESGCGDIASLIPLGQTQVGLWKLPTTSLFLDFCNDMTKRLPHDYMCDSVVDVSKESDMDEFFHVALKSGNFVKSKAVILATGVVGCPSIPVGLATAPNVISWTQLDTLLRSKRDPTANQMTRVLVVGGGLTAVQAALKCCRGTTTSPHLTTTKVTLCSRRPLVERHFDLSLDWFDWRSSTKCMADFYGEQDYSQRLTTLRTSRSGGSVPRMYMKMVRHEVKNQRLACVVGDVEYKGLTDNGSMLVGLDQQGEETSEFDVIVLACGVNPDCTKSTLCQNLLKRWPLEVVGGYPKISDDLEWTDKLFVVGGLGSLNIGPGAANLAGMRRAAQIVANALNLRGWLREANVMRNPFDALLFSDDETDEDSDVSDSDSDPTE